VTLLVQDTGLRMAVVMAQNWLSGEALALDMVGAAGMAVAFVGEDITLAGA